MIDSKRIGNLTELQCITAFTELGYTVSLPFGEDSKYDFIADINDKLYKIQCKTSSPIVQEDVTTAIVFRPVRQSGSRATHWSRVQYKSNEVDFFATFYNGICYLVPQKECSNEKKLRFSAPKNNQAIGINWAKDYILQEVIKQL